MIRIALIPPRGLEVYALKSNMHMVLATRQCMEREDYVDLYLNNEGFKILDNGANEDGQPVAGHDLLSIADLVSAHEIVLPDVMGNKDRTIAATEKFISDYEQEAKKYQCMVVVHAPTNRQALNSLRYYEQNPMVTTVGIPRIYAKDLPSARVGLALDIHRHFKERFQIHFLGSVTAWPTEVRAIAKYTPFARSLDTSLPFNFALARVELSRHPRAMFPRPSNYFIKDHGGTNKSLLEENINTYKAWAAGE